MSTTGENELVRRVEELLSANPPGKTYTMGGCLYVYLSRWMFVMVGDGWLEVTVCAPHGQLGDGEIEDAAEASIIRDFRMGLGARLRERGWREIGTRTSETTMSEKDSSTVIVTEVTCRRELDGAEAIHEEIMWLSSRSAAGR